jgi:hypothetical protein
MENQWGSEHSNVDGNLRLLLSVFEQHEKDISRATCSIMQGGFYRNDQLWFVSELFLKKKLKNVIVQ